MNKSTNFLLVNFHAFWQLYTWNYYSLSKVFSQQRAEYCQHSEVDKTSGEAQIQILNSNKILSSELCCWTRSIDTSNIAIILLIACSYSNQHRFIPFFFFFTLSKFDRNIHQVADQKILSNSTLILLSTFKNVSDIKNKKQTTG